MKYQSGECGCRRVIIGKSTHQVVWCPEHPSGFSGTWIDEVPVVADAADEMPDDDTTCPKCGSTDVEWVDCYDCGGDGDHDCYEEDPINYAPGEEFDPCQTCHGKGGWQICHACVKRAETAVSK